MGANVGTSLTNTAVSMILYRERRPLRRAFGAATMHDIFNILTAFLVMAIENVTGPFMESLAGTVVSSNESQFETRDRFWVLKDDLKENINFTTLESHWSCESLNISDSKESELKEIVTNLNYTKIRFQNEEEKNLTNSILRSCFLNNDTILPSDVEFFMSVSQLTQLSFNAITETVLETIVQIKDDFHTMNGSQSKEGFR